MDRRDVAELLDFILHSIKLIEKRFEAIDCPSDFLADDAGLEKLDSISMRLQSIGEAVKSLSKRSPDLLETAAPRDYWSQIVRTREIISHHYIDLDSEIIYDICENELKELERTIRRVLANVNG
ncbi:HepT-like ribonuclease domain-containing protein [Nitratifractor sp.]